ncbi:MAG: HlyD family secretion protein [Deltaproteobacteria bacterium]|nr:HlyD family secretion protein [Deltaproteobacteria bacterium]MBW2070663.1 HlyD family secretion protein [Deltaproteobacteria bacterium]
MVTKNDEPGNEKRNKKLPIFLLAIFILIAGGTVYWWFFKRNRVSTDNAYVVADIARISSRIPGTVTRVLVDNDVPVRIGQVLVQLDPRDYQVALEQAQGVLERIAAELKATEIAISLTDAQTRAKVDGAEAVLRGAQEKKKERVHKMAELQKKRVAVQADLGKAKRDLERFQKLYKSEVVAEEQLDRTRTAFIKAKAELDAIDAELQAVQADLEGTDQEIARAAAQLRSAKSELQQVAIQRQNLAALKGQQKEAEARVAAARLKVEYCTIRAPITGYVAQKNVQVGDRILPAQPLMAIVPLQEVYVEANFKEIQLEHVRIGQPVTIHADVYPSYTYHGKVTGIRAGTGAAFSLLPPENATGNWIKVVQRVPVKIVFDEPLPPEYPLRVGFSLEVTIDTADQSGDLLLPFAPAGHTNG